VFPEETDPLIGSMLGKDYRVLKPIGAGGMAVVYLVEHQTLLKQFAAKVLSSELTSSLEARARFTHEAHSASQLDHENIVSISDFGVTVDQRPFFVMELLRGQTLDQRLAQGPMTLEEIVAISVPVAHALAYAHAEGIVHLDVKPENIFLVQRRHGRWGVKVVDFGIAKTPHSSGLSKPGETSGSPMFMAPEMCRGDEVDQRADVYSFGILLYLMMCGRLPFVDDNLHRVLQMQVVQQPTSLREINAEILPELAEIVERALAKHPDDRFPSMEALLHSFEAALPIGSDRLLIEARSGTSLRDTPFAGTLSVARQDSHRMSRESYPPPMQPSSPSGIPSSPSSATPSSGIPSSPSSASPSSGTPSSAIPSSPSSGIPSSGIASIPSSTIPSIPSGAVSSSEPAAPRRRRLVAIVLATAIVGTLIGGVLIWRQIATAPTAAAGARPTSAAADLPPGPIAAVAASRADVALAAPQPDVAVAVPQPELATPPPAQTPATGDDKVLPPTTDDPDPAAADIAKLAPVAEEPGAEPPESGRPAATAKQPHVRPKHVTRQSPKQGRRGAGAGSAETPTASLAGSSSPGPQIVADVGARVPEVNGGQRAPAESVPPLVTPPPVISRPVIPPPVISPPVGPGTLDATPSIASLEVKGPLPSSTVRRSVDRTLASLRACYRTAARAAGRTPAVELHLTFEVDENSLATRVATSGASFGSLASCAIGVVSHIRTAEAPDVGTARVTVVIRFRPS
jgi:serine/threonine-protein kinase